MTSYCHPPTVQTSPSAGSADERRHLISTPQGGKIAVDIFLHALWEYAHNRKLEEIIAAFANEEHTPDDIRVATACLAEAGVLQRDTTTAQTQTLNEEKVQAELVSIIIPAYNSREWLEICLPSLYTQTYSPLEIIIVDNGSTDGSANWIAKAHPRVRLECLAKPSSLAHALNKGVSIASGTYFCILNQDVWLEPDAIAQMVNVAGQDRKIAAVAAKLKLMWSPAFLNGIGNHVRESSWGSDIAIGHLDLGQFDTWRELPSACFAATLIPRSAWNAVGQIDEGFPLYYEDSEWSYRARLLGYSIYAAPQAVVYHAFSGKVPSSKENGLSPQKLRRATYGRLRFATKIVGSPLIQRFLWNYVIEDLLNFLTLLLQGNRAMARAYIDVRTDYLRSYRRLRVVSRKLQRRRKRSDRELFGNAHLLPQPLIWQGLPELTLDYVRHIYLPLIRSGRTRPMPEFADIQRRPHILIVSNDIIAEKMAGPGMRYLELARALSKDLDVTLAVPAETKLTIEDVKLVAYQEDPPQSLPILVDNSDMALISGYMVKKFPQIKNTKTRLIIDLYDPFLLENLHYYVNDSLSDQERLHAEAVQITNELARLGDFFICGSERQRDFWMGVLAANRRINPRTFAHDTSMRSLIEVVGIGFPSHAPRGEPMLRGIHPAIPADAQIVLWGGGIWDWLDPLTLVHAWKQVVQQHPKARPVFLGTRHPNPAVPRHKMAAQTEALAEEIGEKDKSIIFIEWVPYAERERLLHEAAIGVTLHPIHIETRYSLRTRVLDYLWARLPVLMTEGDVTSEWIKEYDLGAVVPPFDAEAVASALSQLLNKPKEDWASHFDQVHTQFNWSRVVQPLLQYCLEGDHAPDWQGARLSVPAPEVMRTEHVRSWTERMQVGFGVLFQDGLSGLMREVMQYVRWKLQRR